MNPSADDDLVARVGLQTGGVAERGDATLFPAIPRRRTYRKRFDDHAVAPVVLAELFSATRREALRCTRSMTSNDTPPPCSDGEAMPVVESKLAT